MSPPYVTAARPWDLMGWREAIDALRAGHRLGRSTSGDLHLRGRDGDLFSRACHIDGLGYGLKAESLFSGNAARNLPTSQGAMLVFSPVDGHLRAIVDSRIVTGLKTAADSVLGAQCLADPGSRHLLIVGAGVMAENLARAYCASFPSIDTVSIWARDAERAAVLADRLGALQARVGVVADLEQAVSSADIISTATMSRAPLVHGAWVKEGAHVDLVGGFTPDMRESDDALIAAGSLHVDCRDSTLQAGDIAQPCAAGVITPAHIRGDLYDLVASPRPGRTGRISVYKNGGGAHLDLMVAARLLETLGL